MSNHIRISDEAHEELIVRKEKTDVPIIKQVDKLLDVNQQNKRNNKKQ